MFKSAACVAIAVVAAQTLTACAAPDATQVANQEFDGLYLGHATRDENSACGERAPTYNKIVRIENASGHWFLDDNNSKDFPVYRNGVVDFSVGSMFVSGKIEENRFLLTAQYSAACSYRFELTKFLVTQPGHKAEAEYDGFYRGVAELDRTSSSGKECEAVLNRRSVTIKRSVVHWVYSRNFSVDLPVSSDGHFSGKGGDASIDGTVSAHAMSIIAFRRPDCQYHYELSRA